VNDVASASSSPSPSPSPSSFFALTPLWDRYNQRKARQFHEAKGKEDGVTTLASGVQYKVLTKGKGKTHPKATYTLLYLSISLSFSSSSHSPSTSTSCSPSPLA